jgi:serine/threonine protein kinase
MFVTEDKGRIKVGDFGVSEYLDNHDDQHFGMKGSIAFLAPEGFDGKMVHGKPVDMWAAGVTLFCMMYGRIPFGSKEGGAESIVDSIKSCGTEGGFEIVFPHDETDSPKDASAAETLMRGLMTRDPEKRWTLEQCRQDKWLCPENDPLPPLHEDHMEPLTAHEDLHIDDVHAAIEHVQGVAVEISEDGHHVHEEPPKDCPKRAGLPKTRKKVQMMMATAGFEMVPSEKAKTALLRAAAGAEKNQGNCKATDTTS